MKQVIVASLLVFGATPIAAQEKCPTVLECAQKAVEISAQVQKILAQVMPSGAVIGFDLKECPDGWLADEDFADHFVVGASPTKEAGKAVAGVEAITLGIQNIPEHKHLTMAGVLPGTGVWGDQKGAAIQGTAAWPIQAYSGPAGAATPEPVSVLPSYKALLMCRRR